jgi:lysozyme
MKSRICKRIIGLVLGLTIIAALVITLLYAFKPQLLWRIHGYAMHAMFVDRLRNVPYSETKYDGIDVSKHNGVIKWKQVAENKNIKFVYIKATEGSRIIDPLYTKNVKGAKSQGLLIGSYHFLLL